ncbi:MAG: hypothetical protein U0800_18575 [Isosphaeraceae bacterium]
MAVNEMVRRGCHPGGLPDRGRAEEALTILREPIADQESLVANDNPDNREVPEYDLRNFVFRRVLADLMARKAQALAMQGRADEAVLAVGRAVAIVEPLTESEPCYLDDLAPATKRSPPLCPTRPGRAPPTGPWSRSVGGSPRGSTTRTSWSTTNGRRAARPRGFPGDGPGTP